MRTPNGVRRRAWNARQRNRRGQSSAYDEFASTAPTNDRYPWLRCMAASGRKRPVDVKDVCLCRLRRSKYGVLDSRNSVPPVRTSSKAVAILGPRSTANLDVGPTIKKPDIVSASHLSRVRLLLGGMHTRLFARARIGLFEYLRTTNCTTRDPTDNCWARVAFTILLDPPFVSS